MEKFTEAVLEDAIIKLLGQQGYPHLVGADIQRAPADVLIIDDLKAYLRKQYKAQGITGNELDTVVRKLQALSASDLYDSNKTFCKWLSDGFLLKREDAKQKDIYIQLVDYSDLASMSIPEDLDVFGLGEQTLRQNEYSVHADCTENIYKLVNQLEIDSPKTTDPELRIPDGILYVNGLPLVVFEFKSAIREEVTLHEAYVQITTRYKRAIPQLFVFNAFCVISDGVNNKMGTLFSPYEFYYGWRKISGDESIEKDGIDSLYTMLHGLFDSRRLREVIRHFIYFPDKTHQETKIICRYPQYYAATKLYENIKLHQKSPDGTGGDGKGGTYFGATGCGKSFTMQFLVRLLMKSVHFSSPTIVLITDRTDLDGQLSEQFENAKAYIGDQIVQKVESRVDLRKQIQGRKSGGVFLTTIHKFTEDIELLTDRCNVICISDEAHRSQINLDQKVKIDHEKGTVKTTYGFAKYLHDSLPNATYVGFTGTPVDATLDVFGEVVDSYTMTESVKDEITVPLVYEGRAAKVILDSEKLKEIEEYYKQCEEAGANENQVEESKKAMSNMGKILGDPDRISTLATDFVKHYEARIEEGATIAGKAMFVSSSRAVAWLLYQELVALRPEWFEEKACIDGDTLTEKEQKEVQPSALVCLVMTRNKDDDKELWDLLGTKDNRRELDKQFKQAKSNFKIAIVVDMWLTGFDVPFLDTIYIDKPISKHNLIQTISRVNRKFKDKNKGLVVDYIGIKKAMNEAMAHYSKTAETDFEDVQASVVEVKNNLDLLAKLFYKFDDAGYFSDDPVVRLESLKRAADYAMVTEKVQKRFMDIAKRLKAAYDICCGTDQLTQKHRDYIHLYLAVRSIIYKLTKGNAPDTAQMNAQVQQMLSEALKSDGVEEIFKMGEDEGGSIDLFDDDYLDKIDKIKLPNTKVKLLQKLLQQAIGELKKTNRMKGVDFTKQLQSLVDKYNERKEDNAFTHKVHEEAVDGMFDLMAMVRKEYGAHEDMGIDFEEKAFYDILAALAKKYDFTFEEDKLIELAQAVKEKVDGVTQYADWNNRDDIKSTMKVDLIMLLAKHGYPPVDRDEVYKEVFEQAENFKKYQVV
jgi:type I restriction enzyme R subunit